MRHWTPSKHILTLTSRHPSHSITRSATRIPGLFAIILGIGCLAPLQATVLQAQTTSATRTSLTVTSAALAGARGTQTVLTAHVTDFGGEAVSPPGDASVSFDTAAGSLGAARVDDSGNATLTITSVPATESGLVVHATYHPGADGSAQASVSAPSILEPAVAAAPDFTITANPATVTAKQGQYGTTAVTITPLNGFSEQVTLSCSNVPAQVTCNFSPVIQTTANGAFTSTLEIQTQTAAGALSPLDLGRSPHTALAWLLPGVLALTGIAASRRRAFRGVAMVALLAATSLALGGCSERYGYNHHPPVAPLGTPVGNYTLNIAASGNDGSAVTLHNLTLALQVQ